jgi:CHAT domain-containing protein
MSHRPFRRLFRQLLGNPLRSLLVLLLLFSLTATLSLAIAPVRAINPPVNALAAAPLMEQGKALYDAGKFVDAVQILQQAAQSYKHQGDPFRQAIALSNLALAHQQLGQWQAANQAIAESVTLLKQSDVIQNSKFKTQNLSVLAQAFDIQGDLQLETGQTEQALVTWQQAESIYQQLKDVNGLAQNQMNQAQALRVLGYYRRALTMLTALRPQFKGESDSFTKIVGLRSLGNALRLVGDFDQSRDVLQQSLELAQRSQPTPESSPLLSSEMSAILFGLGNTASAQQDKPAAIAFYQKAAQLAPTALGKVQAQINLFNLLLTNPSPSIPPSLLPDIQTHLAQIPPSQASIYAQIHFAQLLLKSTLPSIPAPKSGSSVSKSAAPSAAQLLATAIQQAHDLGDRRAESYALGNLGMVYEQTKQWDHSQKLTQQALNLALGVNAPDIAYRWHWQLGRVLKRQGAIPQAILEYDAAVTELRSLRSDLVAVNREVQFSFRESVEPLYRESVELLVQSQNGAPTEQNLNKARQQIEALQLAELDNFFREACLDSRTVLLDKIIDQDNPTAAVIYPILLPDHLEVIVKISQQPLHHHTINISKPEVEKILQDLQKNLTQLDATAKIKTLSQQVYSWLIAPIEADLERQRVNTLVFVLDGALRSIPMAGLYDGKQYLVEKYAVALSMGLQLLPPKSLSAERLNVLAAGLAQPPAQFQDQFSSLPEIKSEFDLIAKTGVPTQQLLDQAFTRPALSTKVNSAEFNVVHLATHGQFSSQAKDTFILAADGPINVTQLDALLRSRTQSRSQAIELLVLSACQTAKGDDRATLGLAGVAIKAGARSTLASLWHIDDRSTAILIGAFYHELTTNKVTKAEALRRAQVTLLKNYPNYTRPGYWAAYVLVGNWL